MILGIRSKKSEVETIVANTTTKAKDEDFKSVIETISTTKRSSSLEESKNSDLKSNKINSTLANNVANKDLNRNNSANKLGSNKMNEKLVSSNSTKKEDVVNECEEDVEEVNKVDDSLMILLSLLANLKGEDINLNNIQDIDNSNIELINFIKETLNDITSIIGNENVKELIPDGLVDNALNSISDLLEKAGLNDSNVSNLLADFKEMINTNLGSDKELVLNASKTIEEIVELLTVNSENINKEVVNSSLISKEVKVNSSEVKNNDSIVVEQESKETNTENSETEEFLDSNSEETSSSLTKDEKVLNSILNKNNTDNTVVNRFAVFTNDYSISSSLKNTESLMVNAETAVHDVVQTIKYMATEGIQELMVKVNPRELGELIISIVKDGDSLRAEIKASSKETYNLILQNSEDLKKYLGEQNLKVHNVEISLTKDATDNHHFFGESFEEGKKNNNRHSFSGNLSNDTSLMEEEEDLPEDLINSINMLV